MKRFRNILVFVGGDDSDRAVERGVALAVENGARLTLMDVVKPLPRALGMMTDVAKPAELERLVANDHRSRLIEIASQYDDADINIGVVASVGDAATEIIHQVVIGKHDLVIKTADGLARSGQLFGSVAKRLLRQCPCPVWVLKRDSYHKVHRILAAIDVEAEDEPHRELNHRIMDIAFSIATNEEAELHVVSAWEVWMEASMRKHAGNQRIDHARKLHQTKVTQAVDELHQVPNTNVELVHMHLEEGAAANVIRSVANEIQPDLLVMGTVCRTGIAGVVIGNTAETVLSEANCSVLALKPAGFVCPLEVHDVRGNSELAPLL